MPNENDPQFKQQFLNYFLQVRQFISNKLYRDEVFKEIIAAYDKGDRTQAISQAVLGILDAIYKETGVIELRTAFAAGQTTLADLMQDIEATGRKPLTTDETNYVTQIVMKTYLNIHKGEYDPALLQQYLTELQQKASNGELQQQIDQVKNESKQKQESPKGLLGFKGK